LRLRREAIPALCRRPWPFERCRMADPDGRQRKYLAPNRLQSVVGRVSFPGARPVSHLEKALRLRLEADPNIAAPFPIEQGAADFGWRISRLITYQD
jgi:hypothetical protein